MLAPPRLSRSFIAFVVPAYETYKAITRTESSRPNDHAQGRGTLNQVLLTYWSVVPLLLLVSDATLAWTPFYWRVRLVLVLWLVFPEFTVRGASVGQGCSAPCASRVFLTTVEVLLRPRVSLYRARRLCTHGY